MKITLKRLEIIFVIVYSILVAFCFVFFDFSCIEGSAAGFSISMVDWYVLKVMAKKWLRKGKYSFLDSGLRFAFVGVGVWFLLKINVDKLGIIAGLSVVPVSLSGIGVLSLFRKITV